MRRFIKVFFVCCIVLGVDARGAESTIVALYQNCQPVSRTIFIDENFMPAAKAGLIIAQAESEARDLSFDRAIPHIIRVLESHGLRETEVTRRGQCVSQGSGRFVEVLAAYCRGALASAEIHVDGKLFLRRSKPETSIDSFMEESVAQLRKSGIWDKPRVSISNAPDCSEQQSDS